MAVPTELDAKQPMIPDFGQRRDDRPKIDFPLAKHQMFVHARPHILDVDIRQPPSPSPNLVGNRQFSLTVEMADIDC